MTAGALLLALPLLPAFWPGDAAAHTCDNPFSTDLIAGKTSQTTRTKDAGDVKVCNDGTTLTITYEATYPFCLLATDLHVATSVDAIPQNKQKSPTPGQFAYGDVHDCVGTAPVEIPLEEIGEDGVGPGDTVFIAAHAKVEDEDRKVEEAWGQGTPFDATGRRSWAMAFEYEVQAPTTATSCVCDELRVIDRAGTSGADILATLCPAGELGATSVFRDEVGFTSVAGSLLSYQVQVEDHPAGTFQQCTIIAGEEGVLLFLTETQFEDCRAHLRASCGQPEP